MDKEKNYNKTNLNQIISTEEIITDRMSIKKLPVMNHK